jgi:GNAT superfamily N-acetyltransferase
MTPRSEAFRIREASLSDASDASALVSELGYPTRPDEMLERLAGILSDSTYAAFVAEREGVAIGLGGASLARYFEKDGPYARLVILVVAEAGRGLGVGTALVRAVERWAAARGARELVVTSGSQRREAHRFYEGCGFRATGIRLVKDLHAREPHAG